MRARLHVIRPDPMRSGSQPATTSLNYSNGGGAPIVTPRIVGLEVEEQSYLSDNNASIVSRGKVVLGDGHSVSSGYDTDVVHIRDVMHLAPRSEPPAFDDSVAPHERVGLVYYDLNRNTLRVSTAALEEGQDFENLNPREATIVWRDIALVDETVTPSEDVRHGGVEPAALSGRSRGDVLDATERAKDVARQGRSPYASTRLTPVIPEDGVRLLGGEMVIPVILDGLSGDQVRYYWRINKVGPDSRSGFWQEVDGGRVERTPGLTDTSSIVVLTPGVSESIMESLRPAAGDVLELAAIDAGTGQVAGTSFRLTEVDR